MLKTFADQAVIAIENTRLFEAEQVSKRDLQESLDYQTAVSEVLEVISRSPSDLQPVVDTIVRIAKRLCSADRAAIWGLRDGDFQLLAHMLPDPAVARYISDNPLPAGRHSLAGRAVAQGRTLHVTDVQAHPELKSKDQALAADVRTVLHVPLLREKEPIGVLTLLKTKVEPFSQEQIELVETFADQAVIAIENTRLFEAEQASKRELQEALDQQTATGEILRVISSSVTNIQPVFDTISANALRLCAANFSAVLLFDGHVISLASPHNLNDPSAMEAFRSAFPRPPRPGGATDQAILTRSLVHIPDVSADPTYPHGQLASATGYRSILSVPMLREGQAVGAITVAAASRGAFSARQIELLQTFADQAVIAIENTRLFEAEQASKRGLQQSLEYQTATSEVLGAISRSPSELQPVLDTIVKTASRLCNAEFALIYRLHEGRYHPVATNNTSAEFVKYAIENPIEPVRGSLIGRTALEMVPVHIPDVLTDAEYTYFEYQEAGKYRSMLGVPLLRDGSAVGVLGLLRATVLPFTDKEIELVSTFADQAVIAMENTRLFEAEQASKRELQESLEYQTATSDVLNVISRSAFDLQVVLDALVESATRLCNADHAWLFKREGDFFRLAAIYGKIADADTRLREFFNTQPVPVDRTSVTGRAALEARVVQVADVLADKEYTWTQAQMRQPGGSRPTRI